MRVSAPAWFFQFNCYFFIFILFLLDDPISYFSSIYFLLSLFFIISLSFYLCLFWCIDFWESGTVYDQFYYFFSTNGQYRLYVWLEQSLDAPVWLKYPLFVHNLCNLLCFAPDLLKSVWYKFYLILSFRNLIFILTWDVWLLVFFLRVVLLWVLWNEYEELIKWRVLDFRDCYWWTALLLLSLIPRLFLFDKLI